MTGQLLRSKIRILIADDHPIVREGLRALIKAESQMEVVGEAANGLDVVGKAQALNPDLILLDMVMPGQSGLAAIVQIKQHLPEVNLLILTGFDEDEMVVPAIRAGALGYILKDAPPREVIQAIRTVYRGESYLHPLIARRLVRELSRSTQAQHTREDLTEREREVLILVAQGYSNQGIADILQISERTVLAHVSHILDKLQLENRTQATLYALRNRLIDLDDTKYPAS